MAKGRDRKKTRTNETTGAIVYFAYLLCLLISFAIIGKIVYLQFIKKEDPEIARIFRPHGIRNTLDPSRGSIISYDGRLLAMSTPMYQIRMDCTVQKEAFARSSDGAEKEREWLSKARDLSQQLSATFRDKSADEYYSMIYNGRKNGSKYLRIGPQIDHETLQKVKKFPLFNEGGYSGGMIVVKNDTRQYPYGTLARRTIGYIKDNSMSNGNNHIGLEGKYDYVLHGKEGVEWLKYSDNRRQIQNYDSTFVAPEDGLDVRTTLNIDIQDVADHALRNQIQDKMEIEGGCVVILDVKTGAVRAMVNLLRDSTNGNLNESLNIAISRKGEPGSVFKTTTLMTCIEDGIIKSLDDEIPTNHGYMAGFPGFDEHITQYEAAHGGAKTIPIIEGYKVSSNYMFRWLAVHYYNDRPKEFLDHLYQYKLGEAFDFDLEGLATPSIPSPDSPWWSKTDLGQVAMGYSVAETPLHIVTFYNAIANKGRMMKPYLVEAIEENGIVKEKHGPSVLNASICRQATADTILRGLKAVVEEGTAKRLKSCHWHVAGKTGTSWVVLSPSELKGSKDPYSDIYGRKKSQATFVCFFPAENPKYTAIITIYSALSHIIYYGGTIPALAMGEIVDALYAMEPEAMPDTLARSAVPRMPSPKLAEKPQKGQKLLVPDVKGYGLKDAVYSIENSGYRCQWSGSGTVQSQTPAAGKELAKGQTVTIALK